MPASKPIVRKRVPPELAVIDHDRCTGCEACVEVCPVDCIGLVRERPGDLARWCEIDWDRCIGCRLCIRIPTRKQDRYKLEVCPWDAIEMVPIENLVAAVDHVGGPPEHRSAIRERLLPAARRQRDLAAGTSEAGR